MMYVVRHRLNYEKYAPLLEVDQGPPRCMLVLVTIVRPWRSSGLVFY